MKLLIKRLRQSGRVIASVSMTALLTASMPIATLAQDGVVRIAQQQPTPQQPKPPETPPGQKTGVPKPDIQRQREQQEEQGGTNKSLQTEREKRNVPSPGTIPATPSSQQPSTAAPSSQDTLGTQNPITQPLAMSPEIGKERVGITPGQVQALALQDAIAMSLQNNLDIEQFRQGVQIAQSNLYSLRGIYDIVSSTEVNYRSQTIPVASLFAGGGSTSSVTQRQITWNLSTNQLFERTGGSWQVDFDNSRVNTSSTASTLTTQYNPTLTFTFVQPLLRNFSTDLNRRQINIAKKSLDLSDSQFRQRVIEIINQVQRAYWDLVFAIRNEQIARDSVELTRTQLENNQKMVEAGTLPPIDLRSTEAALESRKGDVVLALQGITTAENVLKALLIKDSTDKLWNSEISPTDTPLPTQTQAFNLEDATRLALKNRPELDQMRLQQEQKEIDISFFKNQTKPQLDLVGFYTNNGLAGTPSSVIRDPGGFDDTTQGLITNLNAALAGLNLPAFNPTPPAPSTSGVPTRFDGGYFQSLKNLFGQDFKTYQFGVRLSFPWKNRTAEGNLGRALAEQRQLDARQRQLVQSVQIDVRNALQAVEASRQRFEAAQAAKIAAKAQLAGEQEKFRAGLSSNFFVLQRQTDLAVAEGTEVRALTDYNKALADLQRVTGMTLVNNNVQVTAIVPSGKR
ncbi:MAG TPA: TolC family protein [Blastocatellia bacterium]|nr:TolC family protein [Blastocatellia bacterium]